MPELQINNVSKYYGTTKVIDDVSVTAADKEFLVLLGPSGCGKSTMLRMIAGLAPVSSGDIIFDGKSITNLTPRERNVAFVFQSYALYPQMTVRRNIAFPLIMDRFRWWHHFPIVNMITRRAVMRDKDVNRQVNDVARMLELEPYLDRRPRNLSGGQRQRVAVARALVRDPSLYLLDEPLSNLDAQLRTQMRSEISALYQRAGRTFIYVTHDQVEAMTMGTRIVILDHGIVQQIGSPSEVYDRPANTFVAKFIGTPPMNLVPVSVNSGRATIDGSSIALNCPAYLDDGDYKLGIRPEFLGVEMSGPNDANGRVALIENLGAEKVIAVQLDTSTTGRGGDDSEDILCYARAAPTEKFELNATCKVRFDMASVSWFDSASGARVENKAQEAV